MRAHCVRLVVGCGAAAAALVLGGCGSEGPDTNTPRPTEANVDTSGAQFEVGNTINYGSFGTTAEIDCGEGKSLNVAGSNNTLTVRGTCFSVIVGGADNQITFERIDNELDVVGLNNTVTYQRGDPKVDDLGSGNLVRKA
jgi:Protein of unknown function (DUF3060)